MIYGLLFIHFSYQEESTNKLAGTYSLKYHHDLRVMKAINEQAHCYKRKETS